MKTLKKIDLTAEEAQLRLVKKLRDAGDNRHQAQLDKLHRMLAEKTLEYYCADGYHAFFDRYALSYISDDGYSVKVRGHEITVAVITAYGDITGSGSTWDYISGDLEVSDKPAGMEKRDYDASSGVWRRFRNPNGSSIRFTRSTGSPTDISTRASACITPTSF
jgi:hypothetical protein